MEVGISMRTMPSPAWKPKPPCRKRYPRMKKSEHSRRRYRTSHGNQLSTPPVRMKLVRISQSSDFRGIGLTKVLSFPSRGAHSPTMHARHLFLEDYDHGSNT